MILQFSVQLIQLWNEGIPVKYEIEIPLAGTSYFIFVSPNELDCSNIFSEKWSINPHNQYGN